MPLTHSDNELHGPTAFYDNWVARTIKGEAFIPVHGWDWGDVTHPLSQDPAAQRRFDDQLPLQVFSCWNGMLASRTAPYLPPVRHRSRRRLIRQHNVRLRSTGDEVVSESFVFCQDLWRAGYNKLAMAPRVKVGVRVSRAASLTPQYNPIDYERVGQAANTTGLRELGKNGSSEAIAWEYRPPKTVWFYDYHIVRKDDLSAC